MVHVIMFLILIPALFDSSSWGFNPHKLINRQAIFSLPPAMIIFYKHHLHFISEQAVNPDRRRYAVPQEGARHYIDLDYYGTDLPRNWDELVKSFPRDSIEAHGILPWHLILVKYQLTKAFRETNIERILRISSDAGHYIADAHVPLHTTLNYNGQLTGQRGIHGFWETRIPELFSGSFNLWVGRATYQSHWHETVWDIIMESHAAVDSVLNFERDLTHAYPDDKKFSYEVRLSGLVKVYSEDFSKSYHQVLNHQVERRLRAAIRAVGDFWYTCWVDAGQPDLASLKGLNSTYADDYLHFVDSIWSRQHATR